MEIESMEEESK